MKFLLCKLPLAAFLLTFCSFAFSVPSNNPYNQELDQIRSAWISADPLNKLVLMDRIFCLRDYIDDTDLISGAFVAIAKETLKDGLIHAEAEAYLNDIAVLEGQATSSVARHWFAREDQRTRVLAQAANNSPAAENLELLAELEHIAELPQAADHMQQAAQLAPTARRWEQAAALTDDPLKKFSSLQSALALEPDSPHIRLQLAIYYIGRQQLEKAHALLQQASAAAPDDFVLGEHLAGLYLNLGLRSAALAQLRKLEGQFQVSLAPQETQPRRSPLWLQARMAVDYEQIGLLDNAVRLAGSVVRSKSTDREQLQLLIRFHERRHMLAQLQSDYAALLHVDPNSAELWSKLAQLQVKAGDLQKARDALTKVIALEPDNAAAHRQLAQLYTQLGLPLEGEKELAAYSALLRKDSAPAEAEDDSGLLTDTRKLAAEAFRHPPQDGDVALADIRVQELYESGLTRVHIQHVFYIGSDAGADAHRVATIRYSPGSQAVRLLHARVLKPDGSAVEAQEEGETPVAESAISMYYDMRSRQLRFTGLEKGDIAELEYSLLPTTPASPYPGYFGELVTLAGRTPVRLKRYALIFPRAQPVFVHAEKVPAATATEKNGRRTLVWELHNVAALAREARSPGITEISPYVHVSTMADWQTLGSWYAGLIRPQFILDQPLTKELNHLVQDKHSEQEKITAIQEFVLRSTHYVALEFGVYSYKPYPVTQTYARRFGDCKDKASLMIALLRAAGIEAEIALVRTRSLGDVVPTPASIALFDHAIVYVPKYSLWLDGTADYAGYELPLEDQGALALTVNLNGKAELRQIPTSTAADNYTKRTIRAQLTRQGIIHFNGSTLTRGEGAPVLRRELAVPEQQLDLFRQRLAEVFPTVQVDSVAVHGTDDLASDVSVDFEGALNLFQHQSVVTLGSSWMPRNYASNLAPASIRAQDLVLGPPWITEEEIHLSLPSGATVQQLPKDEEVKTTFGSVRLHYARSGHAILIQSRLEFERTRISIEEYPAFRQFCAAVERSFSNQIVVGLAR